MEFNMNDKLRLQLRQLKKELAANSWEFYLEFMKRICQVHADNPHHVHVLALLRARDWDGIVMYADSISRQKYATAWEHFQANQLSCLVKKYPFPQGVCSFDPEKEAIRTFDESEKHCDSVNQRFRGYRSWSPFEYYLDRCRKFISYVLGVSPDLDSIYDQGNFGPGASIGVHGNATNVARKISSRWSVSPSAYHYGRSAIKRNAQLFEFITREPGSSFYAVDPDLFNERFGKRVTVVNYNKIAFVPKTVRTFRSIAVEPLLNGYLQKGVDLVMRRKLQRVGIDLSDQSINQEMARNGSLLYEGSNPFVTIDLSSASDSISIELVRWLVPPEWFQFLDAIRSTSYTRNGEVIRYFKFCSMGNGFCFPLETLLFTAACYAVDCGSPGRDFHVYGDDIVIRRDKAPAVLSLLEVMGFSVNRSKTFLDGPFRESCGVDSYEGKDVRPFTLDYGFDSLESFFKFLNLSRRNELCSAYFEGVRDFVKSRIPDRFLFSRPYPGPADSGVDSAMDEFMHRPQARWILSTWSWSWLELISVPLVDREAMETEGSDISLLWTGLSGGDSSRPFTLRRLTRTRVRRVSHSGGASHWLPPAHRQR
jgi:hypothetical protein